MTSPLFEFPSGPETAIICPSRIYSFDDLHRLRHAIRQSLAQSLSVHPQRILGCLEDNENALFALLFLTEISDYMPINPALAEAEIERLVATSGSDVVVVSARFLEKNRMLFGSLDVVVWDDIVGLAISALNDSEVKTPPNQRAGRLILHTSGSTGTPKHVPISVRSINASAKNIAKGHDLRADDHALNALPSFHIGALVDVMLAPFAAGGHVSITDKRGPEELASALIAMRPTWVQVVPTLLRRLVDDIDPAVLADAGTSLRFIRSISAPVPEALRQQVEGLFGCPVIEMYGMTETAGQIATGARPPAARKTGSVGKPVGVDVAIMDRFGNALDAQTGEVCVKGPTVFEGYEGVAKDDVFFEGWFRTGDLGQIDKDGYLFLKGRLKEMINVGGEKVSPHEVETAVLDMPDVLEAAAYALPHPSLGEQVGLTIASKAPITPKAVKTFLEGRLVQFKRPNDVTMVQQLPRLANAKVDRVLLKRRAEAVWHRNLAAHSKDEVRTHASPEEQAVARNWMRILKCRRPEGEDDFFSMGGDSLSATQLLLALEQNLNREISPNQMFEAPTFSGLVAALREDTRTTSVSPPRPIRFIQEKTVGWPGQVVVPNGILRSIGSLKPGHPLFWSGQAEDEIAAIIETFGQRRPLYVTGSLRRFPMRTETDFATVAEQLADEIETIQPEGPIALGGFCGGAWVMHETAESLLKRGRDIRVFLSVDYWPERVISFPTIHALTHCENNSGRIQFAEHSLAAGLLHRSGLLMLDVDSNHRFDAPDIAPYLQSITGALDGKQILTVHEHPQDRLWSFSKRQKPPHAKIKLIGAPKVYRAGETATIGVRLTNTSTERWDETEVSGLSLQMRLVNLDGHVRKANLAYGKLAQPLDSGETRSFSFDVTFPDKKMPFWMSCNLVSQGLRRFEGRTSGAYRRLVFPNPIQMFSASK